nr:hypothetical protein [Tanacetum cinerariifolium]
MNDKYNSGEGYHAVPPPYTGNYMPSKPDLVFADDHVVIESVTILLDDEKEDVSQPKIEKKTAKPSFVKINFVKAKKIHKTSRKNIEQKKRTINGARPMPYVSKTTYSSVKMPINKKTTFKNSNFNKRVNTVRFNNVTTARPKAVVSAVKRNPVNTALGNEVYAVKASACWV